MPRNDTVKSSPEGKINLKSARKKAGFSSQEKLAEKVHPISVDTIKRLEGGKERVERWQVEKIAQELKLKPTDIVSPED